MKYFLFTILFLSSGIYANTAQPGKNQLYEFQKGRWSVFSYTNQADPNLVESVTVRLPAEKGTYTKAEQNDQFPPYLLISCYQKYIEPTGLTYKLSMSVKWDVVLSNSGHLISSSFDKDLTSTDKWTDRAPSYSIYTGTLTDQNARNMIKKLLNTNTYVVKTMTFENTHISKTNFTQKNVEAEMEFDVKGLGKAITPLMKYCPI